MRIFISIFISSSPFPSSCSSAIFTSAHRMNIFLKLLSVLFSLHFFWFRSFLLDVYFLLFPFSIVRCKLFQWCWIIFQTAWFSLIWSIIIFHFDKKRDSTICSKREWNGRKFIERVPLWLLSYQQMNRKSNIARKFILMIDASNSSRSSKRRRVKYHRTVYLRCYKV